MSQLTSVTDAKFSNDVLQSKLPTLVDFWAEWCGPCRALTPVLEELAGAYADRVQFCKLNIDEQPNTPAEYAVRAIPTLALYKDGELVDQLVGLTTKAKLEEMLNKHLSA